MMPPPKSGGLGYNAETTHRSNVRVCGEYQTRLLIGRVMLSPKTTAVVSKI